MNRFTSVVHKIQWLGALVSNLMDTHLRVAVREDTESWGFLARVTHVIMWT